MSGQCRHGFRQSRMVLSQSLEHRRDDIKLISSRRLRWVESFRFTCERVDKSRRFGSVVLPK